DPRRPEPIRDFIAFTEHEARRADSVYILGDLFEAWIGDDDDDAGLKPITAAIAALTATGIPCHLMHGNRDFLIGTDFCAATGCRLLDDYAVIDIGGEPVLLTHGDLLCTDDTRYMTLREQLRSPAWQRDFLAKPLAERRRIAAELRQLSQTEMAAKTEEIMDVNAETVRETMRRFGVTRLLHGHTHRPGIHRFELDGQDAVRVVLNDWYGPGGYALWDAEGPRLMTLESATG
ncbi:MAG: UDP-2,3-diacylglucosamine diphosphatase, partial [Gammaproteobacteria bacterium]|nr:UDP-2,3-diacylglucosamine diphosphatase [Gammaproteobacteria bacterium]